MIRLMGTGAGARDNGKRMNELQTLLGASVPILSAPMAGISGAELVRAVASAGGFGFLGGGYGDRLWLETQLAASRDTNFGVGFIGWAVEDAPEIIDMAIDAGARAIFLSFGGLDVLAPKVRSSSAVLVVQVQTVWQAVDAVAQGAQIVVAQGGEAGGHGGLRGTMSLVPAVCDAVGDVPVVAAGGIADGRGLAAALALGAAGVLCGTAFYAVHESMAHPEAKKRVLRARGDDTLKSSLFDQLRGYDWPQGPWGLRTLRNQMTDELAERWSLGSPVSPAELQMQRDRLRARRHVADFDIAPVVAGEAVDLVKTSEAAASVVGRMVEQARLQLARLDIDDLNAPRARDC